MSAPTDWTPRGRRRLPMMGASEEPALLGLLPQSNGHERRSVHLPARDELSTAAREHLAAVRDALLAAPARGAVFALDALDARDRAALWEMLGDGEVSIVVQGTSRYEIEETALPGVYRVRTERRDGESQHLEVGGVPAVVMAAAEHGTSPSLPFEDPPPAGLMNALPLLTELRHRMGARATAETNHVVSLTLLPLNAEDGAYLARALGVGPILAESRGYGTCRVQSTARRGIWSVQYFNAMDALILDTLEIGGVPGALLAAPEDLEDSAARLTELLDEAEATS